MSTRFLRDGFRFPLLELKAFDLKFVTLIQNNLIAQEPSLSRMGRMPDCACLISVASIRAVTGSVFMPRFGLSLGQCVSHAEEGNIIAYPPIYRLLCGVTSICYPHYDKLVQILRHLCRFATKKLFLLFF